MELKAGSQLPWTAADLSPKAPKMPSKKDMLHVIRRAAPDSFLQQHKLSGKGMLKKFSQDFLKETYLQLLQSQPRIRGRRYPTRG